jgi:hypothetical protein
MQSGLKLNMNTTLEPGFSYTFILDWDVQKSVVMTGAGMYNLKPVIRVNTEVNSGSIEGNLKGKFLVDGLSKIENLANATIEVYQVDADAEVYVTESNTNAAGDFLIQGLSAGNYKLKIVNQSAYDDVFYVDYESELITVNVGVFSTAEPIVLMTPTI